MAVVNSWIIFKDLSRSKKSMSFSDFLVPLAEQLIQKGRMSTPNKRKFAQNVEGDQKDDV